MRFCQKQAMTGYELCAEHIGEPMASVIAKRQEDESIVKTLTLFDFTVFTNQKTFYAHFEEGELHISIQHTPNNYFLTRAYKGEHNTFGNLTMAQALEIANKIYQNYLKLKHP